MKNTRFLKNQNGNLLVEAMLGIALAGAGFLTYYEIEHKVSDRKQFSKVTSNMYQQYNVFLTALEQYAQKNNSTQTVSCQELKNGYLASDFNCTDYLGDTLEGILVKNQTQTPTAYVVGIPTTNSQNMLNSYNVSSVQVLNQALAQSQPENTTHGFYVVNLNNYIGYPVTNISQSMSFSTIASYLPQQGLKLGNNSYVISLVDATTINPSATPPSCTSSSSVLNPPGTWVHIYLSGISYTECSYTEWQPYQSCSYANGTTSVSNNGPPFSSSSCWALCPHGSVTLNYTGSPQHFTITPSMTQYGYLCFALYGAGGGGANWGGAGGPGGITTGVIPISDLSTNTLTIIIGGGGVGGPVRSAWGDGGGGGGGTFVCEGTQCNAQTVLLAAGGGGGGGQCWANNGGSGGSGNENGENGGGSTGGGGGTLTSGGASWVAWGWKEQCYQNVCKWNGYWSCSSVSVNPYSCLGWDSNCSCSWFQVPVSGSGSFMQGGIGNGQNDTGDGGPGGYNGGGNGGDGWGSNCGGGGGGGGWFGGGGGNTQLYGNGGGGGGGSGYCASIVQSCSGYVGGANNGGGPGAYSTPGHNGGNGLVVISW
jgi:hypothetical protein